MKVHNTEDFSTNSMRSWFMASDPGSADPSRPNRSAVPPKPDVAPILLRNNRDSLGSALPGCFRLAWKSVLLTHYSNNLRIE